MTFVSSRIRSGALRTLFEPKDVGYSCEFSKNSPNPILVQHILDSISRSIESPTKYWARGGGWLGRISHKWIDIVDGACGRQAGRHEEFIGTHSYTKKAKIGNH